MLKKIITIALIFLTSTVCAQEVANNTTADIVKQTAQELMENNDIPGVAVELYVDGKPSAYYFGYANREKKTPVTEKTIFEVGSLAKLMTSLLLAQVVDTAKAQFDDSLTNFIPSLPDSYEDISLLNLATHTGGLAFEPPSEIKSQNQLTQYLTNNAPKYPADEKWIYSNLSIGMLGAALENVTHKNFNQLYTTQILNPLKMQPITYIVPTRYQPYYAQGYNETGQPVPHVNPGLFPSAYALKISAGDMQKFLSAAIGLPGTPQKIFYPMRMTQSAFVDLTDKTQGLGWQMYRLAPTDIPDLLETSLDKEVGHELPVREMFDLPKFDGDKLIDKTGGTNGFRAYIALIPNKKSGVVILANKAISRTELVDAGREILFKVTNLYPVDDETKTNE